MTEEKKLAIDEQAVGAPKPRAGYQKPAIKKEGNLKKITALSFQPPA
jgi:hypothetical protein